MDARRLEKVAKLLRSNQNLDIDLRSDLFSPESLAQMKPPPPSEEVKEQLRAYYDLTPEQAEELFGPNCCGGASTPETAAAYIEAFVASLE